MRSWIVKPCPGCIWAPAVVALVKGVEVTLHFMTKHGSPWCRDSDTWTIRVPYWGLHSMDDHVVGPAICAQCGDTLVVEERTQQLGETPQTGEGL